MNWKPRKATAKKYAFNKSKSIVAHAESDGLRAETSTWHLDWRNPLRIQRLRCLKRLGVLYRTRHHWETKPANLGRKNQRRRRWSRKSQCRESDQASRTKQELWRPDVVEEKSYRGTRPSWETRYSEPIGIGIGSTGKVANMNHGGRCGETQNERPYKNMTRSLNKPNA